MSDKYSVAVSIPGKVKRRDLTGKERTFMWGKRHL